MKRIEQAIKWLLRKFSQPLTEEYIKGLGFKKTYSKGHYIYFVKGKMNVKWDFHVEHALVTVKWGKGLRFFGNVEIGRAHV